MPEPTSSRNHGAGAPLTHVQQTRRHQSHGTPTSWQEGIGEALTTETATGNGDEAKTLADKTSRAWVAFAKSGNPNVSGLPDWPLYNRDSSATMVFDDHPLVKFNHDLAQMQLLDPDEDL